jgi:hypothetical protein
MNFPLELSHVKTITKMTISTSPITIRRNHWDAREAIAARIGEMSSIIPIAGPPLPAAAVASMTICESGKEGGESPPQTTSYVRKD